MQNYFILLCLWIAYYGLHSALATHFFKEKVFNFRYYRIFYNIISIIGLLGILIFMALIPTEWLWARNTLTRFIGMMLATYGVIYMRLAFRQYSMKEFLGFKISSNSKELKTEGQLQYVRHPIYFATLLIVLGYFFFSPSITNLITFTCTLVYIIIGAKLEENKLEIEFGEAYKSYKSQVPMLIPKKIKFH